MTEQRTEYGVERSGGTPETTFIAAGYTLAGAKAAVAATGKWTPKAVRVMRRTCSAWEEVPDE